MGPLQSRLNHLFFLIIDPAGDLAPNHALLLDEIIVLGPDGVDVVSLAG